MQSNHATPGGKGVLEMNAQPGFSAKTSPVFVRREKYASEAELIRRVLAGQHEVFYKLVHPYEGAVFMVARGILRNGADAEEAAQEAILKAFTNLAKFRGDSKFSTWLLRIATNEALMKLRKEHRKLFDSLQEEHEDGEGRYVPREFADWREIPSVTLLRKELRTALSRALAALPLKYRLIFILRDVQHFTIAETAEALGISAGLVKTRLLRARLQMRDALGPGMDGRWASGQRGLVCVNARYG
jgi:RNA polymerase sigma-70 factor (ECF subfamily)